MVGSAFFLLSNAFKWFFIDESLYLSIWKRLSFVVHGSAVLRELNGWTIWNKEISVTPNESHRAVERNGGPPSDPHGRELLIVLLLLPDPSCLTIFFIISTSLWNIWVFTKERGLFCSYLDFFFLFFSFLKNLFYYFYYHHFIWCIADR